MQDLVAGAEIGAEAKVAIARLTPFTVIVSVTAAGAQAHADFLMASRSWYK